MVGGNIGGYTGHVSNGILAGVNFLARCFLVLLIVGGGCKKATSPPPVAKAAGNPQPVSKPAPRSASLQVDGEKMEFPVAEMRVRELGSGIRAELSTSGGENSLHLDMAFPDLADASELDGAEWDFAAPDEPTADTLDAIRLRHGSVLLDPVKMKGVVRVMEGKRIVVEFSGTFKWFEPAEAENAQKTVDVAGEIEAVLQE